VYLAPLLIFDVLYPRRVLPEHAPSAARLACAVAAGIALYDCYFFVGHIALHVVPWLRPLHAKHHLNRVVRARDVMRLSPAEEVLDVACSVAALNTIKAHPLSRAIYNAVLIYLLCELHSGYDFPWALQNMLPGLWKGSRAHTAHHLHGNVHFAKFLPLRRLEKVLLRRWPSAPLVRT
jgi:sterol desaturase/sphingolipid hydroxylase (fatty acid hydroxylase superfamily)